MHMIRTIAGDDIDRQKPLIDEMFRARKRLFRDRLGWDVTIDAKGREIDRFDGLSPLYLVALDDRGRHEGSLRLLPTTGETMLRDQIASIFDGVQIRSPDVGECTRFCVGRADGDDMDLDDTDRVTAQLLLGLCETAYRARLSRIAGLFDYKTILAFEDTGWLPDLVGQSGKGRDAIFLGMWNVTRTTAATIRKASGISGSVTEPRRAKSRRLDTA